MQLKQPTPIEERQQEVWADISGYESQYQVSNWGAVRSFDWISKNGQLFKGRFLSPATLSSGYKQLVLCRDRHKYNCYVHILVAKAFVPNPLNLPEVNHCTGDKTCNYFEDLEWSSSFNNTEHAHLTGLIDKSKTSSSYYGVHFRNRDRPSKWKAWHSHTKCIGHFKTELGAAWAYEKFTAKHNIPAIHNVNLPPLPSDNPDYERILHVFS